MQRQKFEEEWKNAFEGAEVEPTPAVWANVELDLERASGSSMKRRLLFFQLLAAASMVFAMGIGGIYYLQTSSADINSELSSENGSSLQNENRSAEDAISNSLSNASADNQTFVNGQRRSITTKEQNAFGKSAHDFQGTENSGENSVPFLSSDKRNTVNEIQAGYGRALPSLYEKRQPTLNIKHEVAPDPGLALLVRLEKEERMLNKTKEKKRTDENVWASVGVGVGSYTPQSNSSAPSSRISSLGTTPSTSNPTGGSSYSVGFNMAGKVARKIVVQGGVSYLAQNAQFKSSSAAGQNVSLNEFSADNRIVTSPYKVNSNLKYFSVPVQAGYAVLDKNLGILVSGGIATDLFLQSTLTPENSSFDAVTQGAGDDSPYRTVTFSGLVNTEFSYKLAERYRISVNPGLRYGLQSIYKTEVDSQIAPVTFDVSLRFRYIFK